MPVGVIAGGAAAVVLLLILITGRMMCMPSTDSFKKAVRWQGSAAAIGGSKPTITSTNAVVSV